MSVDSCCQYLKTNLPILSNLTIDLYMRTQCNVSMNIIAHIVTYIMCSKKEATTDTFRQLEAKCLKHKYISSKQQNIWPLIGFNNSLIKYGFSLIVVNAKLIKQ